jgi:hypothetical protein
MNTEELKSCGEVYTKVVIEEIDNGSARVHTLDHYGEPNVSFWVAAHELIAIPPTKPVKPAKKYQVGDEVIHINRPQMGIGKIVEVKDDSNSYDIEIGPGGEYYRLNHEKSADYIVQWEFYPRQQYTQDGWSRSHAEEFLLSARRKA